MSGSVLGGTSGGTITIEAQGDGLKSDNEEDATLGYVRIEAGRLSVIAAGDAIEAQTTVTVTCVELTLTSGGGYRGAVSEGASAKGIKGLVGVTIDDGEVSAQRS